MKMLLGVLLVLAACGGGDDDDAVSEVSVEGTAPADEYDLGGDVSVAVLDVMDPVPVVVPPELTADIQNPVQPGTRWVAVELEYRNDGDAVVDRTLAYDAALYTSEGGEAEGVVESDFTPDDMAEVPKAIPSGSSVRGWEMYEVANGAEPNRLLLYGEIGDDPVEVDL